MPRASSVAAAAVALTGLLGPVEAFGFSAGEHQLAAKSAVRALTVELCGLPGDSLILPIGSGKFLRLPAVLREGMRFEHIAAGGRERSYERYQLRRRTVREQLARISRDEISGLVDHRRDHAGGPGASRRGAVGNYLVVHWLAIRLAHEAGGESPTKDKLIASLAEEGLAQRYLIDAFAAGHLLMPAKTPLSWTHPVNLSVAYEKFSERGVYVINSCHEEWRTVGDGRLLWYPAARRHVEEACASSLREVVASFYGTLRSGDRPASLTNWLGERCPAGDPWDWVSSWTGERNAVAYYAELRLPTLLLVPMPITAAWSVPAGAPVPGSQESGRPVRARSYVPQLQGDGNHAEDLSPEEERSLYTRESMPSWLAAPPATGGARAPLRASVLYHQPLWEPPSYRGLLLGGGWGLRVRGKAFESVTVGWGFLDGLLNLDRLPDLKRVGAEVGYLRGWSGPSRDFAVASVVGDLSTPTAGNIHIEGGYGRGLSRNDERGGPVFAAGLSLDRIEIPLFYLAVAPRLKYQVAFSDPRRKGFTVEAILH